MKKSFVYITYDPELLDPDTKERGSCVSFIGDKDEVIEWLEENKITYFPWLNEMETIIVYGLRIPLEEDFIAIKLNWNNQFEL